MKLKVSSLLMVAVMLSGCKTFNTVIHKGPSKEVPAVWDFDEPVTASVFNTDVVNLKKACKGKDWVTAKIYHQWFFGWKIAAKCKA